MSEKKIQLPDFLIAELYKGTLVDISTTPWETTPAVQAEQPVGIEEIAQIDEKITFLGENQKGVIIIVNQPEAVFLMEDELTFLTNILKACYLNLADIAIINTSKYEVNYENIKTHLKPTTILLFDVEPSAIKLPFMIPAFQIQKFDGCTIMIAPALPLINQSNHNGKLLKTKLWMSLKSVFNIG